MPKKNKNRKGKGNGSREGKLQPSVQARLRNSSFRGGFPDRTRVSLRFVTNVTLNVSSSGTVGGRYVFRGNGAFDPDYTSTGLQPANYDDFAAIYDQYRVWGSRITVQPMLSTTTATCILTLGAKEETTTSSSIAGSQNAMANPYFQSYALGVNTSQYRPGGFSMQMSTPRIFGETASSFLGKPGYSAQFNAVPSEVWYWHICTDDLAQSNNYSIACNVILDYDIEWFNRTTTSLDLDAKVARLKELTDERARRPQVDVDKRLRVGTSGDRKAFDGVVLTAAGHSDLSEWAVIRTHAGLFDVHGRRVDVGSDGKVKPSGPGAGGPAPCP